MPFSINEALATINAVGGLTKASKFFVRVFPPASLGNNSSINDFSFLCEVAQLPGVGFATDEIRMSGYGLVEKRAYAPIFQDVSLVFFNDSQGRILKFFHSWMQSIYNFNSKSGPQAKAFGLTLDTLAYPSEYYGSVDIMHYNDAGTGENAEAIVTYTLDEAYPIAIGDIGVDWNLTDTLVRVPVTFAYRSWMATTLEQGAIDENSEQNARLIEGLEATRNNGPTIQDILSLNESFGRR